jgi:hypothetical protein
MNLDLMMVGQQIGIEESEEDETTCRGEKRGINTREAN